MDKMKAVTANIAANAPSIAAVRFDSLLVGICFSIGVPLQLGIKQLVLIVCTTMLFS